VAHGFSPAAWAKTQSPTALLVLRLLLVANTLVTGAVGGLCLAFVARPAGAVAAGLVWTLTVCLVVLVPYTNPRRGETSRW
jgi:hypothetical protein